MRPLLLFLILCALGACGDDPLATSIDMRVVTTEGENPLEDADFNALTITVIQGGEPAVTNRFELGESFDVGVSIPNLTGVTRLRVLLDGDGALHGATPAFIPITTRRIVRVPVGAPRRCDVVPGLEVESRPGAAAVRVDTFVVVAGGEESDLVEALDLLELGTITSEPRSDGLRDLEPLPVMGPAAGTLLTADELLFVQDDAASIYDLGSSTDRVVTIELPGASSESALLQVPERGVLVVGPGAEFSWVSLDRRITTRSLSTPRTAPLLAAYGGSIMIVGGNDSGALIERFDLTSLSTEALELDEALPAPRGIRLDDSIWLLPNETGPSRVLRGCPACRVEPGPEVNEVGEVRGRYIAQAGLFFATEELTFEPVASSELDGGFVVPYESGMVLHGLGIRDSAQSGDVELCFPEELNRLE